MKKMLTALAIVALVSAGGHSAWGQYPMGMGMPGAVPPGYGPPSLPSYPYAQPGMPMMMPAMPMMAPQMAPSAFAVAVESGVEAIPATEPAFRVEVSGDGASGPSAVRRASFRQPEPVAQADWGPQDSYGKGCTGKGCDGKGCVTGKCLSCYTWRVFGEYLYLRARDAEMPYAVEDNLNIDPRDMTPVQISRIAMVDPDYSSGFRVGFGFCLDPCTELVATFTKFESQTTDSITRGYSNIPQIFPMLAHPSSFLALTGTAAASASYGVDFDLIDVDYRRIVRRDCQTDLAWLVGVRYGALDQTLTARYTDSLSAPRVDSTVATDIDFHGVGLKLGFEGERYALAHPVLVYAKGFASLLAGEFDATYQQTLVNRNAPDVNTSWTAGRIVPTFDLEVGTGFCLPHGHTRATIGYSYSVWTNVVKNEDWIRNVQTNEFSDMSGAMTFDGMVVRVEGRF